MPAAVRLEFELPAAEIDGGRGGDRAVRHDRGAALIAQEIVHALAVEFPALGDHLRQGGMADELGMVPGEGRRAQNMVGVDVRHDHIADWQRSAGADRLAKRAAIGQAAAGIDHGDQVSPHHEADVADGVLVGGGRNLVQANAHEQAGRYFRDLGGGHGEAPEACSRRRRKTRPRQGARPPGG